ncbi:adenosine deaminase-like protein isoform X2 [Aricia agestis]|nr:adenosine deaminase-like protein isoform X2 [Aricia agestis]
MIKLSSCLVDKGIADKTNIFLDEFEIGSGDTRNLADCFQVFNIAHSLTSTPETLSLATELTLKEFEDDACCYIELRSTPKETPYMSSKEYIETIVKAMLNSKLSIIPALIISINRAHTILEAKKIADLAIEFHKKHPNIVVGIELSGNPAVGQFLQFIPILTRARNAGLKVTLHCGEISNPNEVMDMLNFKPDRIGHGVCIHPLYGGNDVTWQLLCKSAIPVEVCLTSNVNTKSTSDYLSHHFKKLYEANVPTILCTDDKGVFSTSLSQEYLICAQTFNLSKVEIAELSLKSCDYIFLQERKREIFDIIQGYKNKV